MREGLPMAMGATERVNSLVVAVLIVVAALLVAGEHLFAFLEDRSHLSSVARMLITA